MVTVVERPKADNPSAVVISTVLGVHIRPSSSTLRTFFYPVQV